ncbi:family 43 glycosylhydrolase [Streptomyces prasinopilosus]|uniref:family 43 glycosylhydrolase n=1 Tax=Streptomyces prasinopilosus TaxID=67344 RepID=UPI0006EB58C1
MARRLLTLPAAPLLALTLGQSSAQAASFGNPVKAQKGADPWIVRHGGDYYLVSTSWTDVITLRRSATLAGLATAAADAADCSTADAADVRQWTWPDNACRQWRPDPV